MGSGRLASTRSLKKNAMNPHITIGEKYGPAMKITDQGEADHYLEQCVRHNLDRRAAEGKPQDVEQAIAVEKQNLGYYAGYYNSETRERIERLFQCAHPVFGRIAEIGQP